RTRTSKGRSPTGPKPVAYASSATPAGSLRIGARPAAGSPRASASEDEREGLAHGLGDEPDQEHDDENSDGAERLPRRREHQQRGEAPDDEEGGRHGPAGIGAEPEPDEERSAEHHDPERHGARVGPAPDGPDRRTPRDSVPAQASLLGSRQTGHVHPAVVGSPDVGGRRRRRRRVRRRPGRYGSV